MLNSFLSLSCKVAAALWVRQFHRRWVFCLILGWVEKCFKRLEFAGLRRRHLKNSVLCPWISMFTVLVWELSQIPTSTGKTRYSHVSAWEHWALGGWRRDRRVYGDLQALSLASGLMRDTVSNEGSEWQNRRPDIALCPLRAHAQVYSLHTYAHIIHELIPCSHVFMNMHTK